MSGHSKWKQIKHKKETTDQKRGQLFSKLLKVIAASAKAEPNPEFNPRLRAAILKAKENKVPQENIERAIKKSSEAKNLEELVLEAYGPEGVAILITAITNNKNRTISGVKNILNDNGAKWAEVGSVRWAFNPPTGETDEWQAKFKQEISPEAKNKLANLVGELRGHDDVEEVYTNSSNFSFFKP